MPLGLASALIRIRLISSQPVIFPYIFPLVQFGTPLVFNLGSWTPNSFLAFLSSTWLAENSTCTGTQKGHETRWYLSAVLHISYIVRLRPERSSHKRRGNPRKPTEIHKGTVSHSLYRRHLVNRYPPQHSLDSLHPPLYPSVSEFSEKWPRTWFLGEIWLMMLMH